MRLEIYKDDVRLDFENSLMLDEYIDHYEKLIYFEQPKINFSSLHNMLKENDKMYLELAFQDTLKENR